MALQCRDGSGIYQDASGRKFLGTWLHGQKHGRGKDDMFGPMDNFIRVILSTTNGMVMDA